MVKQNQTDWKSQKSWEMYAKMIWRPTIIYIMKLLTSWWVHAVHLFCCLPLGGSMFFICFVVYLLVHVLHLFCCLPLGGFMFFICFVAYLLVHVLHLFFFVLSLFSRFVWLLFAFCFVFCSVFFFNLYLWFCPFLVAPSVFTNVYLREYN